MMYSQYMGGTPHKGLGLLSVFDLLSQQLSRRPHETFVSSLMTLFLLFESSFLFLLLHIPAPKKSLFLLQETKI